MVGLTGLCAAPEMKIDEFSKISEKSDIFSFGMSFFIPYIN